MSELRFEIKATPTGYRVEAWQGNANFRSAKDCKTYIGAKFRIWNYKRRIRKAGR